MGARLVFNRNAYLPLTGGTLTTNGHQTVFFGDNIVRLNGNGMLGFTSGTDPTASQSAGLSLPAGGVLSVDTSTINNGLGALGAAKLLGGNALSASFPMWKRNGAAWNARLGDDTADAQVTSKTVLGVALTVATLPAAASNAGAIAYVTDANATTRLSTVAAGGANKVLVYSDGTNWLIA